jgi:serine kinase of HPr protein (carbohydrate metabolism regulator)
MPTIHASCVRLGTRGVLIRGASGAGKSWLAGALVEDAERRGEAGVLVSDDRVHLTAEGGRLRATCPPGLEGLLEVRGLGIIRVPYEAAITVTHIIDIVPAGELERMPAERSFRTALEGVELPRLAVPTDIPYAVRLVTIALRNKP